MDASGEPPGAGAVLKDEPLTRVEVVGAGERAIVRKEYRFRFWLRWRTLWVPSRAEREFRNLDRLRRLGLPGLEPLGWSADRSRLGMVRACSLTTRLLAGVEDLRTLFRRGAGLDGAGWRWRRAVLDAFGGLLGRLHRAGVLHLRASTRNFLVRPGPAGPEVTACDLPYMTVLRKSIHGGRLAELDLFDALFAAHRRRELSAAERLRALAAYAGGDRALRRRLWRRLARRTARGNKLRKVPVVVALCYLGGRRGPPGPAGGGRPMVREGLLAHYNSEGGARSYRAAYDAKLHRQVSDRLERGLLSRLFDRAGPLEELLDLPCGAGRLYGLFRGRAARVVEADWSFSMLRLSRQEASAGAAGHIRCSGLQIPFRDGAFAGVASIRLNHHLDPLAERLRHLEELMRVARRAVIVTWFSHHAPRAWLRRLRARLGGRKREKFTLSAAQVRALAAARGWRLAAVRPLAPFCLGSGHVFGLLLREETPR